MKNFTNKVFLKKVIFMAVLIFFLLIQFPISPQGNHFKSDNHVNNLPVLSTQLSAQENNLKKNLFLKTQKNKSLLNQEVDFLVNGQTNPLINARESKTILALAQNSNPVQSSSIHTQNLYAQENTSQNSDTILDVLVSEDQENSLNKWKFIGKIIVDWDIKYTNFSPNRGNKKNTETSTDTFYLDINYKKQEQAGLKLELYPSQNLKLKSFVAFKIANIRLNTALNYDTRQDSDNKVTGHLQISSREGFYGKIFKDKGLESPHQGGNNLIIETEKQKQSTRNRESSITQAAEFLVFDNDYYSGLEVGFVKENIKFKVVLELGTGISSSFGTQKYGNSISLTDFYTAATDNDSIFTNPIYFGTPAAIDNAYQKINSILTFADSANVLVAAENYSSITSLINESQTFITDAEAVGVTASSLTPTSTSDVYPTTVLNFYRSEKIYNLFNNLAKTILGLDINHYKDREYAASDLLATDVVNALDDFLAARTLLDNSVTSIVPDFESFPSNTVSGNVALKFDHKWKNLTYELLLTQGSYNGTNWFGNTSIRGGGIKLAIGGKFDFFLNSFDSSLISNYKDKYFINSSTMIIDIKTENLVSNLDFGIDYILGSKSALSLAVGNGEIVKKYNSTSTSIQYQKKNTHSVTEIGYKTKLRNIDFKVGIASVVEQGKSSVNYSLSSLNGNHNLVNGDKLNTTIYKVRFEQQF